MPHGARKDLPPTTTTAIFKWNHYWFYGYNYI